MLWLAVFSVLIPILPKVRPPLEVISPWLSKLNNFRNLKYWIQPNEGTVHCKFLENTPGDQAKGRYEVNLIWKEHHRLLPDNYDVAVNRLNSALKRLWKTPELLQEYNHIITGQFDIGLFLMLILMHRLWLGNSITYHIIQLLEQTRTKLCFL